MDALRLKVSAALTPAPDRVLGKATTRAANFLGLKGNEVALILGVSEAMVSRIRNGERGLAPDSKEGQLAKLLIRVYRSLDAQVGNNAEHRQRWLDSFNRALNGVPRELLKEPVGLVNVVQYLDALRAPL